MTSAPSGAAAQALRAIALPNALTKARTWAAGKPAALCSRAPGALAVRAQRLQRLPEPVGQVLKAVSPVSIVSTVSRTPGAGPRLTFFALACSARTCALPQQLKASQGCTALAASYLCRAGWACPVDSPRWAPSAPKCALRQQACLRSQRQAASKASQKCRKTIAISLQNYRKSIEKAPQKHRKSIAKKPKKNRAGCQMYITSFNSSGLSAARSAAPPRRCRLRALPRDPGCPSERCAPEQTVDCKVWPQR